MRNKDCRFALMMSSYKRPLDCIRQGLVMLNQTYQNFKLFIAVKGVPESVYIEFIKPQFEQHINSGKVEISYHPNKNQLSNFLDTIRGCDIEDFDCFCKIDDDDIYPPDYLEQINNFNKAYLVKSSVFTMPGQYILNNVNEFSAITNFDYKIFGPTMVMSKDIIKWIRQLEKGEAALKDVIDDISSIKHLEIGIGHKEDSLFNILIRNENPEPNRAEYVLKHSKYKHCVIGRGHKSTIGCGFLNKKFSNNNSHINNIDNELCHEYVVEIVYDKTRVIAFYSPESYFTPYKISGDKTLILNYNMEYFVQNEYLILKNNNSEERLYFGYNKPYYVFQRKFG